MASSDSLHGHANVNAAIGQVVQGNGPTNFHVAAQQGDIANFSRDDADLTITFTTGRSLEIRGFFSGDADFNNLILEHGGQRVLVNFDQALTLAGDGIADELVIYQTVSSSSITLIGILGGVAAAGALAAVALSGSSSDDGGKATINPSRPHTGSVVNDTNVGAGSIGNGAATSDATPTVSGTAAAGTIISIYDNGTLIGTVTTDQNGNWSFTPSTPLGEGNHSLTFTATDAAGNVSAPSEPVEFVVDTIAPTVALAGAADDVEPVIGDIIENGGVTNDNKPALYGTGEPGAVVSVYDNGQLIGTTIVHENGTWTFIPDVALGNGGHSFTVTATDAAGNVSAHTHAINLTISATTHNHGEIHIDEVTDMGNMPTICGSGATAGSTVNIYDNGEQIGSTTVDEHGNWSFTPDTPLGAGTHDITATIVDKVTDTESKPSEPVEVIVDAKVPGAPVLLDVVDDVEEVVGTIAFGTSTNDDRPSFHGSAEAGSTVTIYDNGHAIGSIVVGQDGHWSFTPEKSMSAGMHSVTAITKNSAGNVSASSMPWLFNIDVAGPVTNNITTSFQLSRDTADGLCGCDHLSESINTDLVTRATDFDISGTLTAALKDGQMFQISADGGKTWTTVLQNGGTEWNYVIDGAYQTSNVTTYSLRIVNEVGNVASDTQFKDVTVHVDLDAPDVVAQAPIVNGNVTAGAEITFSSAQHGVVEAGSKIALINDVNGNGTFQEGIDQILGHAEVAADGSWTLSVALDEGAKNLSFMVFDRAGNMSGMSPSTSIGVIAGQGFTITDATWGGTTDADEAGLNAAAVTLGNNGLWSFAQSARGTALYHSANALRVYNAQDQENYSSIYLNESIFVDAGSDRYVTAMVFADYNRDGHADVFAQLNQDGNRGASSMWINQGDGSYFGRWFDHGAGADYSGIIAYDKQGDGYLDLVLGNSSVFTSSLHFVSNNAGSLAPEDPKVGSKGQPEGISSQFSILHELSGVDINNDGTIDIAAHTDYASSPYGYRTLTVFANTNGEFDSSAHFNYAGIFRNDGATDDGSLIMSMSWADFNGDGWLDLALSRGASQDNRSNNSNETRIYLNDGAGKLKTGVADTLWFGDDLDAATAIAVDWNGDGRMDLIEIPRNTSPGIPLLWTNNGDGTFSKTELTEKKKQGVTGGAVVDYDWDGARDLVMYHQGTDIDVVHLDAASLSTLFMNGNAPADGTVIHLRILDSHGINTYYGNTVKLYDSKGNLVSTQIINPQSSGVTDSTALVSFYGLDANETYSAQLLRIRDGQADHVGAVAELGGYTNTTLNASWGNLTADKAHEAYVLITEPEALANSPTIAFVGTGYNDTFFTSGGDDAYNGSGGWSHATPHAASEWSATGGMDIVDYGNAKAAIAVDMVNNIVVGDSSGTDTLINIEGIYGTDFNDTFVSGAGNNLFFGRGGDDSFELTASKAGDFSDTLLYKMLDGGDATGGNGHDTVKGFKVGNVATNAAADVLDLSDLLTGYNGSVGFYYDDKNALKLDASSNGIMDFLSVEVVNGNSVVKVDLDGAGNGHEMTSLVTLQNVQTDLETLLSNGNIIV